MHRLLSAAILLCSLQAYADPPGAINPAVTQETIRQTICVRGWTATQRPPTTYTTKLKIQQLRAQGLKGKASEYEEDHWIPLALGGAPRNPDNLQPQPWPEALQKDEVERELHRRVCAKQNPMRLEDARKAVVNWRSWNHSQTTVAP